MQLLLYKKGILVGSKPDLEKFSEKSIKRRSKFSTSSLYDICTERIFCKHGNPRRL